MVQYLINQTHKENLFYDQIRKCYKDWGNRAFFDWCIERNVGSLKVDMILCKVNDDYVYGANVYYSLFMDADGNKIKVGIIGDGWTEPNYRGRGLSTGGIGYAKDLAKSRDCSYLFGFIRKENASFRNMIANNGKMIESRYCTWNGPCNNGEDKVTEDVDDKVSTDEVLRQREESMQGSNHFVYRPDEWEYHVMSRPGKIIVCSLEDGYVVLDERKDQYSVMFITCKSSEFEKKIMNLQDISSRNGKYLFHYTTDPNEWNVLERAGFKMKEGSMAVFDLNGIGISDRWIIHNGDRM